MNNAEKFQEVFGYYATEMWAKSESEFLEWINSEYVPTIEVMEYPQVDGITPTLVTPEISDDVISKKDAIKAYNEAVEELVKAEMEEFNLGDFTECSFNTTQLKLIARKIENVPSVIYKGEVEK